jgi:hypothetical protein
MSQYLTKWDYLNEDKRKGLEETPCNLKCAGCEINLQTEADFAKHFVVLDSRYLNLGECPITMIRKQRQALNS